MQNTSKRQALRLLMRRERRALTPRQRHIRAVALCRHLRNHPLFLFARDIAFYLPNDGEMDLSPLLQAAWRMGKRCYLPILKPYREPRLWFAPYPPGARLKANRFGILEPKKPRCPRPPWSLGLVLAPLVAFDDHGNRLGMGGGFYDRTFAYLLSQRRQPRLLGIAYAFQRLPAGTLAPEPWDVPLWGVATENGVRRQENGESEAISAAPATIR